MYIEHWTQTGIFQDIGNVPTGHFPTGPIYERSQSGRPSSIIGFAVPCGRAWTWGHPTKIATINCPLTKHARFDQCAQHELQDIDQGHSYLDLVTSSQIGSPTHLQLERTFMSVGKADQSYKYKYKYLAKCLSAMTSLLVWYQQILHDFGISKFNETSLSIASLFV